MATKMKKTAETVAVANGAEPVNGTGNAERRAATFDVFRRWGYLQTQLDPLGQYLPPEPFPEPAPEGPLADEARGYYELSAVLAPFQEAHAGDRPALRLLAGPACCCS